MNKVKAHAVKKNKNKDIFIALHSVHSFQEN